MAGRFADGAWLAELAPVQDRADVMAVVTAALGVRDQPGVPAADVLARVLARQQQQQLLLVLDNCEHVIGAAAQLCAALLAACNDVRVLATSREPLRIAGEARYRLGPLTLPGAGQAGGGGSEAVSLFLDRARGADPHFTVDGQAAAAVARLVTRLDGMPLAIELAAARVEALGVAQLLDRLDDRFALLTAGDRLAPSRQRSLAAAVEWSYQLLEETERRVFRAVSVFPGPFTLEAAETVAGDAAGPAVLHLVDCSLLVPPRAGPDGRARYGMLETLRAYGARLLSGAGEQERADATLARWALRVAEEADAGLQSPEGELAAARWLDAEDATMRQVLAWAMDNDAATALRLTAALGWWWFLRGRLPGAYPLLREAAGRAEPGSDGWCSAQFWLGWAAAFSADTTGALGHFTVLRDAVADQPPSRALADGLVGRAMQLRETGRIVEAAGEARRGLAVARQVGYPVGELLGLAEFSWEANDTGDHDDAVQLARQAAQVTAGVPVALARSCGFLLTAVLTDAGDLAAAECVGAAALARAREAGDLWNQQVLLPRIADLDLRAGRVEDAALRLREGLQLSVRTGSWNDLLIAVHLCGTLCAATGRHAEALTLWAAEAALMEPTGIIDPAWFTRRWEEQRRQSRQALEPGEARAAEERGAAMSLATAAEYALLLIAPGPQRPEPPTALGKLSTRERELVTLVARGRTDAQIAAELFISVRTVHTHLDRIRDKTGCRRRADLARLALQARLI